MSQYPVILAGQKITAALLSSMLPLEAYKAADTTRASTTTLADDPDLSLVLDANAVYDVEAFLHFAAIDLARFKTAWTVPSGATGNRSAVGPDQGVILSGTSSGGTGRWGAHNFSTSVTYGSRDSASNQCFALEESRVFTTSSGTLAIQWAQATSNATASKLAAGSYLKAKRIA